MSKKVSLIGLGTIYNQKKMFRETTTHKTFETDSIFLVKWHTIAKV